MESKETALVPLTTNKVSVLVKQTYIREFTKNSFEYDADGKKIMVKSIKDGNLVETPKILKEKCTKVVSNETEFVSETTEAINNDNVAGWLIMVLTKQMMLQKLQNKKEGFSLAHPLEVTIKINDNTGGKMDSLRFSYSQNRIDTVARNTPKALTLALTQENIGSSSIASATEMVKSLDMKAPLQLVEFAPKIAEKVVGENAETLVG